MDRKSFLEAVKTGSAALVAKILQDEGQEVEREKRLRTLLTCAGHSGDPGSEQGSPLYWACCLGHEDTAALLLRSGADPDAPATPWGARHLHAACDNNHLHLARLLLSHGCDVNAKSRSCGDTACHLAAFRGNLDMVRLLVEFGADLRIRNNSGKNVLNEAHAGRHALVVSYLNKQFEIKGIRRGMSRQMSLPAPASSCQPHLDSFPPPWDGLVAILPVTSSQTYRPKLRPAFSCPGTSPTNKGAFPLDIPADESPEMPSKTQNWAWVREDQFPPVESSEFGVSTPRLPTDLVAGQPNLSSNCWDDKSNLYQPKAFT